MSIRTLVIALKVIKTLAQIDQGWIHSTEQEVMNTINKPSMHSNLVTQSGERMKRFEEKMIELLLIEFKVKLRQSQPEEDTAHACDERNLACDLKAVEEYSRRLAG